MREVVEMNRTVARVRVGGQGDLHIPAVMMREAGFRPEEEITLVRTYGHMIIEKPKQFTDTDELLEYLDAQGQIELCRYDKLLAEEVIPEISPEQLHQMLGDVSVPVEKYLREERAKVDDPFCA